MKLYQLPAREVQKVAGLAEDGMGYHLATLKNGNSTLHGAVISGTHFVSFEDAPRLEGRGEGPDGYNLAKSLLLKPSTDVPLLDGLGAYASFSIRYLSRASATSAPVTRPVGGATALPPHSGVTTAGEVFYRVSAFNPDGRIKADGSLLPNTYSTTDTDITVVPSGLAAVGRYALPARVSAKYLFVIRPAAGTPILYGTVTPNFGLAGGGVEVFFPHGTTPGTAVISRVLPEK